MSWDRGPLLQLLKAFVVELRYTHSPSHAASRHPETPDEVLGLSRSVRCVSLGFTSWQASKDRLEARDLVRLHKRP